MSFIAGSGARRVEQQPGLWQEAYPYQPESDICSKEDVAMDERNPPLRSRTAGPTTNEQ
jgi:hypothetical protein